MNLDEYQPTKTTHVVVFGKPKSGKTAIAGELAAHGFKLWYVDLEDGIKTLLNPDVLKPEFRKNVSVIRIPDHSMLPIGLNAFRQIMQGGPKKFCYDHGVHNCPICLKAPAAKWAEPIDILKFTTKDILVIDGLSQLSDSAINKIVLKDRQKDEEYKCTFNDYGTQGVWMKEVLSKIQVTPINLVMLAHEIDAEKSESKEKIVPVSGTRNFSLTVGKYFDEVVYMQVLNKVHKAYSSTTYSNTVLTGGRSGIKLEELSKLSLAPLFGVI